MKEPTWLVGLSPVDRQKQRLFDEVKVKHRNMDNLLDDLTTLLVGGSDSNIIFLTGATGVGKSTVIGKLVNEIAHKLEPELAADRSAIAAIVVEAYANGETRHSFRPLFEDMRRELLEPGGSRKTSYEVVDGRMIVNPTARETIPALRRQVEHGFKYRKTRICVIDEAYHMMRFGEDAAVMGTLKSIVNKTDVHLLLVGSFDLLDFIEYSGQIARRSNCLNFDRYRIEFEEDREEFKGVVRKLMSKWPCEERPNLIAVSDDLLDENFGCVGQLKSMMLNMSAMQFRNRGKWDYLFLSRAAKPVKVREVIRSEIERGEEKIEGALFGQSRWDKGKLKELKKLMEATE